MEQRPVGVMVLTVLLIILGAYAMLMGFLGLSGSMVALVSPLPGDSANFLGNGLTILLGIVLFGVAISLYQMLRWAWTVALVILVVMAIRDIFFIFFGGGITPVLSLILAVILIIYLATPKIRSQFSDTPVR
ncbi:MAG TPA: hypothetical protein EYH05_17600 [Anaerolineae bacterium]|nr:hypothetical protein [Anaerolineae bacterium]